MGEHNYTPGKESEPQAQPNANAAEVIYRATVVSQLINELSEYLSKLQPAFNNLKKYQKLFDQAARDYFDQTK